MHTYVCTYIYIYIYQNISSRRDVIPQSDLVIFVTSAERPVTETEGKLLGYIREWGKKVYLY